MFSISPSALLRYARSLLGSSSKQSAAKHKISYLLRSEVAFIYFKAKPLGELEILPENLDIFNFATLVTFQEHSFHRGLIRLVFVLSCDEPI